MDKEEFEKTIEKLNNRIVNLECQIKNLKDKGKEYTPMKGEEYDYIDLDTMTIEIGDWDGYVDDITRKKNRIIFDTEEKANEYLEYLLEKRKHMNIFTDEEWKDTSIMKFYYFYNEEKKIVTNHLYGMRMAVPYFRTEEETEDFIQAYAWAIKYELGVN